MERTLTLMIQKTVRANTLDDFEKQRDQLIIKLEKAGWCISVEDEGEGEFEDVFDEEEEE
jgi:hypothetical protein